MGCSWQPRKTGRERSNSQEYLGEYCDQRWSYGSPDMGKRPRHIGNRSRRDMKSFCWAREIDQAVDDSFRCDRIVGGQDGGGGATLRQAKLKTAMRRCPLRWAT
jgi:hypothetical protein